MWIVCICCVVEPRIAWRVENSRTESSKFFFQGFSHFRIDPCQCQCRWFIVSDIERKFLPNVQNEYVNMVLSVGEGFDNEMRLFRVLSALINNKTGGRVNALEKSGWLLWWKIKFIAALALCDYERGPDFSSLSRSPSSAHIASPFLSMHRAVCAVTQSNHALLTRVLDPFPFRGAMNFFSPNFGKILIKLCHRSNVHKPNVNRTGHSWPRDPVMTTINMLYQNIQNT